MKKKIFERQTYLALTSIRQWERDGLITSEGFVFIICRLSILICVLSALPHGLCLQGLLIYDTFL